MKRFLKIAGPLYVIFALLAAHTALAPTETTLAQRLGDRSEVVTFEPTLCDRQRLDYSDSETADSTRKHYRVEVWTASWCGPCRTYKRQELPALLKSNLKVKVLDIDKDKVPKGLKIKSVPTVVLYYKDKMIDARPYWRAKDVLKFIDRRSTLKH